jgi:hypothetical protein
MEFTNLHLSDALEAKTILFILTAFANENGASQQQSAFLNPMEISGSKNVGLEMLKQPRRVMIRTRNENGTFLMQSRTFNRTKLRKFPNICHLYLSP